MNKCFLFIVCLFPIFTINAQTKLKDSKAHFNYGKVSLNGFIYANQRIPNSVANRGVQGDVEVEFTIDTSGSITNIKVLNSVDKECENEAIRICKIMPKWTPEIKHRQKISSVEKLTFYFYEYDRNYFYDRGVSYYIQKQFPEAILCFKNAITADNKNYNAYYNIAISYFKIMDSVNACKYLTLADKEKSLDCNNLHNANCAFYSKDLEQIDSTEIYSKDFEFPGGDAAMQSFIQRNKRHVSYTNRYFNTEYLNVAFLVKANGTVSDISILNFTPDDRLNYEAVRLTSTFPKFVYIGKGVPKSVIKTYKLSFH